VRNTLINYICLFALLALLPLQLHAQELQVEATVDKNPVLVNESFTLTISANRDLPRSAFRPGDSLDNFRVGMTSLDSSTQIINGETTRNTRWHINLVARQPGTFLIPAFDIDGVQTQPVELEVIEQAAGDTAAQRAHFVTAEVVETAPYVQQQIIYRFKIHSRDPIMSGSVSAPQLENADIEQLGQDRESQEIINGQRYLVITRTYAITPRRSGAQTIQGAIFEGQVRVENPRSLSGFGRPERIQLFASDIDLDVQPRPSSFPGHWLPSPEVSVTESWEPEQQTITLGEPVSRQISITAQAVRPELLRVPETTYPESVRSYPDRGQTENFVRQSRSVSRLIHNVVIIPSEAGELELPEVVIPWWNTDSHQIEYARLPARTIQVINPPGGIESPRALDSEQFDQLTQAPAEDASEARTQPETAQDSHYAASSPFWFWVALVFLVLWLATAALFAFYWQKNRARSTEAKSHTVPASSRLALQRLKQACSQNDAAEIKSALELWQASRTGKQKATISQLLEDLPDPELSVLVNELQQSLYGNTEQDWVQGAALWSVISRLHSQRHKPEQSDLPPLYPS